MAFLEVRNAAVRIEENTIIEDMSFTADKGGIMSLIGDSGAGKSTLLRAIAGFAAFTKGEISLNGKDIKPLAPEQRPIVLLFQQPLLFPHFSVLENVTYGLKVRRVPKKERERQGMEMLEKIELKQAASKFPAACSGGEQQRIALARALIAKPELLLLDEPFGSLDPGLRSEMQEWVRFMLKEEQTTAVFVTHDKEEAMTMGDTIAVLAEKKVVEKGEPESLYDRPAHPATARLLADGVFLEKNLFYPASSFRLEREIDDERFAAVLQKRTWKHGQLLHHFYLKELEQMLTLPAEKEIEKGEDVLLAADKNKAVTFVPSRTGESS